MPEHVKQISFKANERTDRALQELRDRLEMTQVGAIRYAVSLLSRLSKELDQGGKLVVRQADGSEKEYILGPLGID